MSTETLLMAGSVTGTMSGGRHITFRKKKDPWMATVVDRLGRYMIVIQVMGKGYRPSHRLTEPVFPYELIAVLHMDRIRPAPPRIPTGSSSAVERYNEGVLRVVWESDQVPAGGKTHKSAKGQALARAAEEMRIAHIKEA